MPQSTRQMPERLATCRASTSVASPAVAMYVTADRSTTTRAGRVSMAPLIARRRAGASWVLTSPAGATTVELPFAETLTLIAAGSAMVLFLTDIDIATGAQPR